MIWEARSALGVALAATLVCAGLSACGGSTTVTTSTTNVLRQTKQRLQAAVGGDARRNIRHYWKGRYHFAVHTECRPRTPAGDNWKCTTRVSSSEPGTSTCRIKTAVHGTKTALRFDAPLPFARNVLSEGCPTLNSELPNS